MAIEVQCPSCGSRMRVGDDFAGRVGKCPKCQAKIAVPASPPAGFAAGAANAPAVPRKAPPQLPAGRAVPQPPSPQAPDPHPAYPQPYQQPQAPPVARPAPTVAPQATYAAPYGGAPMQAAAFPMGSAPGMGGFPNVAEVAAPQRRTSSVVGIRRAKAIQGWYRIWIGSFVFSLLAVVALMGMAFLIAGAQAKIDEAMIKSATTGDYRYLEAVDRKSLMELSSVPPWLFMTVLALTPFAALTQLVAMCVLLYKMWDAIQDDVTRPSPGAAVGLLFVPLFNLYWMFVAVGGLPSELNRFARRHQLAAPRASEGLAITWCIFNFVPLLNLANILIFPLALASMSKTAAKIAQQT